MLCNHDQKEILENAVAILKRAELRKAKDIGTDALRKQVFQRKKDFNEVKRLTYELEEHLKRAA